MISEHIISIELVAIHLMQPVILAQKHIFQNKKYLWIEMFKMNDTMVRKSQCKQQVE
jgi:hypothetical protein